LQVFLRQLEDFLVVEGGADLCENGFVPEPLGDQLEVETAMVAVAEVDESNDVRGVFPDGLEPLETGFVPDEEAVTGLNFD
jgi:hypothetical protein